MRPAHWSVSAADIIKAGQAIFDHRVRMANDSDGRHRQPMLYRDYKWNDLPAVAKGYHCDMAISAFISLGIDCTDAPVFEEQAA